MLKNVPVATRKEFRLGSFDLLAEVRKLLCSVWSAFSQTFYSLEVEWIFAARAAGEQSFRPSPGPLLLFFVLPFPTLEHF